MEASTEVVQKSTTIQDLLTPFKVLISPSKTFNRLVQNPSVKGLIPLSALILVTIAAEWYAFASKMILDINGPTGLVSTVFFIDWYVSAVTFTTIYVILYWSALAVGLALVSMTLGGKNTSWRAVLAVLTSLLSVFIVLYAVRALIYLTLPSIYFTGSGSWPPEESAASALFIQSWSPLYAFQFSGFFLPWIAFVWLAALGVMALRALRELSWTRAAIVTGICFAIVLSLFGLRF